MDDSSRASSTITFLRSHVISVPAVTVIVTSPEKKEIAHTLSLNSLRLGTSPDCDIVLSDPRVSRSHCQLTLTPAGIILEDTKSKNGTFVGDVQVYKAVLSPGAIVTIGNSQLVARITGAPIEVLLSRSTRFGGALGQSVRMRALFNRLETAAPKDDPILFIGEPGTGKELLAQSVHVVSGRAGPFHIVDCKTIDQDASRYDLFGYGPGAFPGAVQASRGLVEEAQGGTLFLRDVEELPSDVQAKLLRFIKSKKFQRVRSSEWQHADVRILASTRQNLRALMNEGKFLDDLYYRLTSAEVPRLRDREGDIPLLVSHFLAEQNPGLTLADLPGNTLALFSEYSWPGNVTELRNKVNDIATLRNLREADIASLLPSESAAGDTFSRLRKLPHAEAMRQATESFERSYLTANLDLHGWKVTQTAEAIGMTRQNLHKLMKKYGLSHGDR